MDDKTRQNVPPMKNQGFTLIEILVAMVILGIALLLLLNMTMVSLDGNDWASNTTTSTQAMQQKLENLRCNPDRITSGQDTISGMTRQWEVTSEGSHLKRVQVIISWEDVRGETKADSMTAFIRTDSI